MTRLRRQAMTCGAVPVRAWEPSSAKVTSRTQCRPFWIAQWPRRGAASRAGPPPPVMPATTLAGDVEDLRGVREPEMVHRDGLDGADLDPAVGLVARAVQDRYTMPDKLGAALEQGGLVGLDGQQVVRPLGDHQELGGVAVGLQRIGRDHRVGQVQVGQQWPEPWDLARCAVDLALGDRGPGG